MYIRKYMCPLKAVSIRTTPQPVHTGIAYTTYPCMLANLKISPRTTYLAAQENAELLKKLQHESEAARKPAAKPKAQAKGKAASRPKKTQEQDPEDDGAGNEDENMPETEGARKNRLRRICERKPSGKLHVPEAIHLQWAQGGAGRDALMDQLEAAGWDKARYGFKGM